jgi:hypothetical protein
MADNQDSTSSRWWTLAQLLVWILQQVDLPPQDAEQFCNELKPRTIEVALNALVGALFNALYGAVEGMPMTIARVPCGHGYKDLAAFFPLLPSLDSGASSALRNELRQFIGQQPDIQFNPTWGRWTWPVCVPAAQAAPTPTQPTESAVTESAEPIPGSAVGPKKSQSPSKPDSGDALTPAAGPARSINVGYVDPAIALALAHAIKRARPAVPPSESAPAADVRDQAKAETAGTQSKKRRGTRGPAPEKTDLVASRIRNDIRAKHLTMLGWRSTRAGRALQEGRLFEGSRRVPQKQLTERYDCSSSTLLDALNIVWSELRRNSE